MTTHRFLATLVGTAVLASGCFTQIDIPELKPEEVDALEAAANHPHGVYRLEPGDKIQMRFTFHPEMDHEEIIRPDGKIRVTEVGEVLAAGSTTNELEDSLEKTTRGRLKNPEVVVNVMEFSEKTIYVAGEVGKPGPVPYRRGLTPLQAIVQAGGLRDTARSEKVVLVRATAKQGKTVSRTLDLDQVLHEGVDERLRLAPHDVLFVPRTRIAEADIFVDQYFTQLFPFFRGAGGSVNLDGQQ